MSRSTEVSVRVGNSTLGYTFGSRMMALLYGSTALYETKHIIGSDAVALLAVDGDRAILPDSLLKAARAELAEYLALIEDDKDLLNGVRISLTQYD